jgi:hypothetical protein
LNAQFDLYTSGSTRTRSKETRCHN